MAVLLPHPSAAAAPAAPYPTRRRNVADTVRDAAEFAGPRPDRRLVGRQRQRRPQRRRRARLVARRLQAARVGGAALGARLLGARRRDRARGARELAVDRGSRRRPPPRRARAAAVGRAVAAAEAAARQVRLRPVAEGLAAGEGAEAGGLGGGDGLAGGDGDRRRGAQPPARGPAAGAARGRVVAQRAAAPLRARARRRRREDRAAVPEGARVEAREHPDVDAGRAPRRRLALRRGDAPRLVGDPARAHRPPLRLLQAGQPGEARADRRVQHRRAVHRARRAPPPQRLLPRAGRLPSAKTRPALARADAVRLAHARRREPDAPPCPRAPAHDGRALIRPTLSARAGCSRPTRSSTWRGCRRRCSRCRRSTLRATSY